MQVTLIICVWFCRYEKPKKKQESDCKLIIERFKKHQHYEKAYSEMLSVDVIRNFLMYKDHAEQDIFRNHVTSFTSVINITRAFPKVF